MRPSDYNSNSGNKNKKDVQLADEGGRKLNGWANLCGWRIRENVSNRNFFKLMIKINNIGDDVVILECEFASGI